MAKPSKQLRDKRREKGLCPGCGVAGDKETMDFGDGPQPITVYRRHTKDCPVKRAERMAAKDINRAFSP